MDLVIAHELQILDSHGTAAHDYPRLLASRRIEGLGQHRFVTSGTRGGAATEA